MIAEALQDARILIIDDEPANVRVLQRLLTSRGYRNLRSLTDPMETFSVWDDFRPHLLLLDLNMPGLDGITLMERLRDSSRVTSARPPILVLTADASQSARENSLAMGARDVVTKPFDHDEVLRLIARLLEQELSQSPL